MKILNKIGALTMLAILLSFAKEVSAHVRYLVEGEELESNLGLDISFLLNAIKDKNNLLMMGVTVIAFFVIFFLAIKVPIFKDKIAKLNERADGYSIFTPWMMRLSLGIALIGSGVSGYIVSPVLSSTDFINTAQVFIGFLILAGFAVIPSVAAAISLFIFGLTQDWYLIGNLDFLAMAIALLILDNEKPGLDHLIGLPKMSPFRFLKRWVPLVLRIGIGGAMIFLAVYEKLLNPHISEVVVLNHGLLNVVPVSPEMWVLSAGIIELLIGLTLLFGWYTRISTAIAFVVLSLSFFYFKEDVSSHITLFGVLAVLFITRGGIWSLDCCRKRVNYEFLPDYPEDKTC